MSSATARDCDSRLMISGPLISQLRLSTLATVPVRINRLSSKPVKPGDFADRLLERDLHLGKRRDRHKQRQFAIEHMVLPDITMREDVVAEPLRVPQARAMAEHQPGVRAKHRDVVGDIARVGWSGPDIDQGDAAFAGLDEVEGRHLRHALGRGPDRAAAEARIAVITFPGPTKASGPVSPDASRCRHSCAKAST